RRDVRTTWLRCPPVHAFVRRKESVHRIPHPTFVTMRNAPQAGTGRLESLKLCLPKREAKYFLQEGLREKQISWRCSSNRRSSPRTDAFDFGDDAITAFESCTSRPLSRR